MEIFYLKGLICVILITYFYIFDFLSFFKRVIAYFTDKKDSLNGDNDDNIADYMFYCVLSSHGGRKLE